MELLVEIAVAEKPDARGIAVIICNDYLNGEAVRCKPLFGSRKDSKAMISAFEQIKFSIISRNNATRNETVNLINAVASYRKFPECYNYVVVLFSCHGNGKPAIISSDDKDVHLNDDIIKPLGESNYLEMKQKCIFISAGRAKGESDDQFDELRKVMIACSTEYGGYSADSDNGCPWIQRLAKEIRESSQNLDEILIRIKEDMYQITAQRPQFYNSEKFCLG